MTQNGKVEYTTEIQEPDHFGKSVVRLYENGKPVFLRKLDLFDVKDSRIAARQALEKLKLKTDDDLVEGLYGDWIDLAQEQLASRLEGPGMPPGSTLADVFDSPKPMPESIIDDVLCRQEYMRIAADAKVKKTWLAIQISLCVAAGRRLFGKWQCKKGKVLHLDAELLPFNQGDDGSLGLFGRFEVVAKAMQILPSEVEETLDIRALRGDPIDFERAFNSIRKEFKPGDLSLIVFDSQYRFYSGDDENSNGQLTALQKEICRLATDLDCAVELLHHNTKGDQSGKKITDLGSGAGSQSRFADLLIAFREHELADCVVLEAINRHRMDGHALTIKWEFPLWTHKEGIEPIIGKQESAAKKAKGQDDQKDIIRIRDKFQGNEFTANDVRSRLGINRDRATRLLTTHNNMFESAGDRPAKRSNADDQELFRAKE